MKNEVMQIGNFTETKRVNPNRGRVYSTQGISPCLGTMGGGNLQPFIIEYYEPIIAASRGRDPVNPSRRTAGGKHEQRLELNTLCNTLTTVEKDNYLLENRGYL